MQINTTQHFSLVRMENIYEYGNILARLWRNILVYMLLMAIQIGTIFLEGNFVVSNKEFTFQPMGPAILFLRIYPEDIPPTILKYIYRNILITILFLITKYWKQPKYPFIGKWLKKPWYVYTVEWGRALWTDMKWFLRHTIKWEIAKHKRV